MKTEDIMLRLGKSLDNQVIEEPWCRENEIYTGADYLWHWLSASVHRPEWRLPVLAFDGPPDSGKSVLTLLIRVALKDYVWDKGDHNIASTYPTWVPNKTVDFITISEIGEGIQASQRFAKYLGLVYGFHRQVESDFKIIPNKLKIIWETAPDRTIPNSGAETVFTLDPVDSEIKMSVTEMARLFVEESYEIGMTILHTRIRSKGFRSPLNMPVFRGDE